MIVPDVKVSERDVARHYDELDPFYRAIWGEHVHHGLWATGRESRETAVRQLVDVVAAEAEIQPGDAVLDIGSGYGAAARQIALDYGARVTGITLSHAQHQYAEQRAHPPGNPMYVQGDWMSNHFAAEQFDAVYAIESASHMAAPERFIQEAVRVLRPGGRLVLCVWTAAGQAPPWQVRLLLKPICREGRLAHLATAAEYVAMLERAGTLLAEFRDLSARVRRTWTVAIGRTLNRLAADPQLLRYVMAARSTQRIFLLTMCRLWVAYRVGAVRYCLLKARRPARGGTTANLT